MGHANNIITSPVDVYGDIAAVLGIASGDVWTLYNYSNIKMWSKKKPVPWSVSGTPNLYPQDAHPNDWWKGVNGDCGIVSCNPSGVTALLSAIDGGMNGWTYQRDSLAARVLDFDGYNHGAVNPFDNLYIGVTPASVAPGGTITMEYQLTRDISDTYQLGIFDLAVRSPGASGGIASISGMYPAVCIFTSSGTYYGWASANDTIGDLQSDPAMHNFSITAPTTTGDYKVVPILTTNKKTSQAQPDNVITIPGVNVSQIAVANTVAPYMEVEAYANDNGSTYGTVIYFYCTFYGGTNGGSFDNISLSFETSNGTPQMVLSNVQNQGSSGTLAVTANSSVRRPAGSAVYSKTWSGSISLTNFIQQYGGRARIYPGTGSTIAQYTTTVGRVIVQPTNVVPF